MVDEFNLNRCQTIIFSLFNVSINESYYKFRKRINCSFFSESYFISISFSFQFCKSGFKSLSIESKIDINNEQIC
jgi:hypothetical protein